MAKKLNISNSEKKACNRNGFSFKILNERPADVEDVPDNEPKEIAIFEKGNYQVIKRTDDSGIYDCYVKAGNGVLTKISKSVVKTGRKMEDQVTGKKIDEMRVDCSASSFADITLALKACDDHMMAN